MKLRILDNALRLRLSRPEIDRLIAGECVEAQTAFPGSTSLRFGVYPAACDDVTATFTAGAIVVQLPLAAARLFADDDVTTFTVNVNSGGQSLRVTVEKDFQCLAPRDEDESLLFAHPQTGQRC
ncbi:MAG: hypothetical protein AAFO81_00865 [Pseudomonadota bacterium]